MPKKHANGMEEITSGQLMEAMRLIGRLSQVEYQRRRKLFAALTKPPPFNLVDEFTIGKGLRSFRVADRFHCGSGPVKFDGIANEFDCQIGQQWCQPDPNGCTVEVFDLHEEATDHEIQEAALGEYRSEPYMLWQLLLQQPNGEDGLLLTNGFGNRFYLCGRQPDYKKYGCVLYWKQAGWNIGMSWSLEFPDSKNCVGTRLFMPRQVSRTVSALVNA